jgi:hypothetical protein
VRLTTSLNLRELQRYLNRIGDRWPLQLVMLGGARVADLHTDVHAGAPAIPGDDGAQAAPPPGPDGAEAERGAEYVVVLVSDGFDGMPWLERTYQAAALWDALEMGNTADIHCYTPAEYLRRRASTPAVQAVAERGLLLFADSEPFSAATDH